MIPAEIQKDTIGLVCIFSLTLYPLIVLTSMAFYEHDLDNYKFPFYVAILIGIFLDILSLLAFLDFAYFFESVDKLRKYIMYLVYFHFLYSIFPSGLIFEQVIISANSNEFLFNFGLFYILYNVGMLFLGMFMGHFQKPYWLCI